MQPRSHKPAGILKASDMAPLLSHLDAQEAALVALKSLLYDVGLNTDDHQRTRDLMTRMQAATDLLRKLDHDCRLLLDQLSTFARSPQELSVRALVRYFEESEPDTASTLQNARVRLLRLRWQVRRIAANSAWVISEQRRIRHAVFQQATGASDSDRYDASGRVSMSPDSFQIGLRS